ncbi:MAG: hypothetical protein HY207_06365 [Nitrospirae bacterium]|nr:hypothetical protein [Nitrospirota bacterium]
MIKRIVVMGVIVGALLGATSLSWAMDVKWGGDYRLRGFYIDNLTDRNKDTNDSAAYYSSRFLLTAAATEDNVSGVVTLIAGRTSSAGNGNRLLGASSYGPDGGSDVGILEAYLKANFGNWTFTGGRSVFKLGHGIILDDAADNLRADFNVGSTAVTLATLKLVERTDSTVVGIGNTISAGTGGDADLYVANANFGTLFRGMHTGVFLAYLTDRSASLFGGGGAVDDDANLWTVGVFDGRTVGPMHVHGELDVLNGKQTIATVKKDLKGLDLTIGGKMNAGTVPVGLDLIYASGQDPSSTTKRNVNGLNGNYPVGIIITNTGARSLDTKDGTCLSVMAPGAGTGSLGGSPGCAGGSGLTAVKLSTGYTHGPHVVDVAAIWANASKDPDGSGTMKKDIGIELDATLTWTLTKRLNAMGGIGYLVSGDFYKTAAATPTDNQTVLVTQLSYTF